jgi:hypothetical protein
MPLSEEEKQKIREEELFRRSIQNQKPLKTESYLDEQAKAQAWAKGILAIIFFVLIWIYGGK